MTVSTLDGASLSDVVVTGDEHFPTSVVECLSRVDTVVETHSLVGLSHLGGGETCC